MDKAKANKVEIHLPIDFVTGEKIGDDSKVGEATLESGIPDGWMVCIKYYLRVSPKFCLLKKTTNCDSIVLYRDLILDQSQLPNSLK
jgi:hypothetical protein